MEVREQLVELLNKANSSCVGTDCFEGCKFYNENDCMYKLMADVMIAHGVTVQEWIPVSEKLPKDGNKVIVYSYENGDFHTAELDGKLWHLDCGWLLDVDDFTHWMPLPKPPKGE
jgi:hypothetical protein